MQFDYQLGISEDYFIQKAGDATTLADSKPLETASQLVVSLYLNHLQYIRHAEKSNGSGHREAIGLITLAPLSQPQPDERTCSAPRSAKELGVNETINADHADHADHANHADAAAKCTSKQIPSCKTERSDQHTEASALAALCDTLRRITELRLQLIGRCIIDSTKIDAAAVQEAIYTRGSTQQLRQAPDHGGFSFCTIRSQMLSFPVHRHLKTLISSGSKLIRELVYEFKFVLPADLPPTFDGKAVKYTYNLVLVAFCGSQQLESLTLPITVNLLPDIAVDGFSLDAISIADTRLIVDFRTDAPELSRSLMGRPSGTGADLNCTKQQNVSRNLSLDSVSSKSETGAPSQKMLMNHCTQVDSRDTSQIDDTSDAASAYMSELYYPPLAFNISKTLHDDASVKVVTLHLSQSTYTPRSVVRGYLNFAGAELPTYRVIVTLEHHERVYESFACNASAPYVFKRTFWSYHQYTRWCSSCNFCFQIPFDAIESFSTELISVSWQLTFKFITAEKPIVAPDSFDVHELMPPRTDSLIWSLPLNVVSHSAVRDFTHLNELKTVIIK